MVDSSVSDVVVAVVPREKFSYAPATLDALLSNSALPFDLLYIDGNSPKPIGDALAARLNGRPNARYLRYDYFLGPLQSRGIAIREARRESKYLVILDNDVLVRPGWLEALVRCADEERAAAVVPCVLIGGPDSEVIHYSGGDTGVNHHGPHSELVHVQRMEDRLIDEVVLRRESTTLLEDHCILGRTSLWKSFSSLDESAPIMSSSTILSMLFQNTGEKLMVEPTSRVVYLWGDGAPLRWEDVPQWYLAWSETWNRKGLQRFASEFGLSSGRHELGNVVWWMNNHRRVPLFGLFARNRRLFRKAGLPWAGKVVEKAAETIENVVARGIAYWVGSSDAGRRTGYYSSRPAVSSPERRAAADPKRQDHGHSGPAATV